ncbi:MAG: ATP-binding protein [Gemmatimonadetes bacterium]|nr:ATP-binding protein [Gemmatimonadota bacterium]
MVRSTLAPTMVGGSGVVSEITTPPNPAKLYSSLRESGYSNPAAVADLIDNSIDNHAHTIRIYVEPKSGTLREDNTRIIIADDGMGMTSDKAAEALKLGSDTDHDPTSDLGKYGMGLITASISIGRRLVVLTKTLEGDLLIAVHDLDTIYERNQFIAELRPANEEEAALWAEYAVNSEHGTIILLEKCDKLNYTIAAALITRLKKHLGQVFRLFIAAKSRLGDTFESFVTINGEPVYAVEPLMLEEYKDYIFPKTREMIPTFSELVEDFSIDVPIDPSEPALGTDSLRVRVVTLPQLGYGLSAELGVNAPNQGIYVMRNQREIAPSQTLGVYSRAQDLNRFRAELHVPASLDKRIGIDWTKHRITPDQALQDILRQRLGPHISSIRKAYNRKRTETTTVDHKSYETLIAKKAKLLSLPTVPKIERTSGGNKKGTVTPKGTDVQREGRSDWAARMRDRCEFREAPMTASGPLWDIDMHGQKIIVTFNVDHPLWVRYVLDANKTDGSDQADVLELLHLFSYCLGTAELSTFTEDEMWERLINMRQQLSNNMRVLLT